MCGALTAVKTAAAQFVAPARLAQAHEAQNASCCLLVLILETGEAYRHVISFLSLLQMWRLRKVSRAVRRWVDDALALPAHRWVVVDKEANAAALCMKDMTWKKCVVPPGIGEVSSVSKINRTGQTSSPASSQDDQRRASSSFPGRKAVQILVAGPQPIP